MSKVIMGSSYMNIIRNEKPAGQTHHPHHLPHHNPNHCHLSSSLHFFIIISHLKRQLTSFNIIIIHSTFFPSFLVCSFQLSKNYHKIKPLLQCYQIHHNLIRIMFFIQIILTLTFCSPSAIISIFLKLKCFSSLNFAPNISTLFLPILSLFLVRKFIIHSKGFHQINHNE